MISRVLGEAFLTFITKSRVVAVIVLAVLNNEWTLRVFLELEPALITLVARVLMTSHTGVVSTLKTTIDAAVSTIDALLGAGVQGITFIAFVAICFSRLVVIIAVRSRDNTALSSMIRDFLGFLFTRCNDSFIGDDSAIWLEICTNLTGVFILSPIEIGLAH